MNTSLGINFFRTVNEQGSNGWAQVYARIPFDDYELAERGALFGVVLGKTSETWAEIEAELMEWVDEYFNKVEIAGDLVSFGKDFKEKYGEIDGSWLWITPILNGERVIRVIRWGKCGVELVRSGSSFDLAPQEGKVVKGVALSKDHLTMWSGALGEVINNETVSGEINEKLIAGYGNKLAESRQAGAGLFFEFNKNVLAEVNKENELESVVQKKNTEEEEVLESPREIQGNLRSDLAGEELVGNVKIKDKLINWWSKIGSGKNREIRIEGQQNIKRKKWAVFLGIVFLFVLAISLVTGSMKIKADREAKKWKEFSEPITKNIQEATDLVKINPAGARKLIEDIRMTFDVQKAEFVKGKYKNEVVILEQQLNNAWTVTSGEKESQIEERVNIQLVRPGFAGERMSLIKGGNLLVLDSKMGVVVSAENVSKEIKVLAGKGEGLGWIDAISDGSRVLILNSKGVSVDGKDTGGVVFDLAVNNPVALGRFGANLYILDSGNKEIFKYGAIGSGYGDRTRWLAQGESISVTPVDMAIDSDVWVLGSDGKVERFRRGVREQFILSGLPGDTKAVKMAVGTSGTSIAILDTTKGVVILCSKETGNCGQQLKSEQLKTATDIEYEETGNLLVLTNGSIGVLK